MLYEVITEDDEEFRKRVQMAPEGFSVAGAAGGYVFHALSVEQVKDVVALSLIPGRVDIYILSRNDNGLPDADTLVAVKSAVNAETVRPLTDYVEVHAADLVAYEIEAEAWCQSGPASAAVLAEAYKNIQQLQLEKHAFGKTVPLSAIYAAIHVQGLEKVNLIKPVADLILEPHQVPYCTSIKLNGGR
ncbi:baseplate assembly protein [Maridesulfovibrio hydrothermalis]|uniref:Baseplate J family protein n=1 Tax=Maridesulfovibrio hydrothermalis AM13 = DSM 14728 TaxID=1121451 RepID=L0RFG6_9BACT